MSRSNYDKPFYVYRRDEYADEITIRCASNDDVVRSFHLDFIGRDATINNVHKLCDRLNEECRIAMSKQKQEKESDDADKELFSRLVTVHESLKRKASKLIDDANCLGSAINIIYAKMKH